MTEFEKWKNDLKEQWNKYSYEKEDYNFFNFVYLNCLLDGTNPDEWLDTGWIVDSEYIDFLCKKESDVCYVKLLDKKNILDENVYSKILSNIDTYNEIYDDICDDKINLGKKLILINTNQKIENKSGLIKKYKESIDCPKNLNIEIIGLEELKQSINRNIKREIYVEKGELEIDNEQNILEFKGSKDIVNKSIVCNISAASLKSLYNKHGNSLLNLNLRYFKKKKDVDKKIKTSIEQGSDEFWYLNNGIYIISDHFSIEDKKIYFEKFSIINGGQTTYNIANTEFANDFYLLCKIIEIKDWASDKKEKAFDFANKIAVSSNQQKPIKSSDLIANMPEVTIIKQNFKNFKKWRGKPIYITSKAGEFEHLKDSDKQLYDKKHASIELLIQLHYCWKGLPGTAKNGKSKFYKNEEELKIILRDIADNVELFSDLLWLYRIFDKLKSLAKKKDATKGKSNMYKYFNFYNISSFHIIYKALIAFNSGNKDFKDKYNESVEKKEFYNDFDFKINKELTIDQFKKDFEDIMECFQTDIICNALFCAYGKKDFSQCHNLVKADKGFIDSYSYDFIAQIFQNNEIRDFFKKVFGMDK